MFQQRIMNCLYKLWGFVGDEMELVVFQGMLIVSVEAISNQETEIDSHTFLCGQNIACIMAHNVKEVS